MNKNKNVIIIVLLSMLLPITLLIISILVYEDETPWEGWVYSNKESIQYVDDYPNKETCIEDMNKKRIKLNMSSFSCGKSCDTLEESEDISSLKCLELLHEKE